MTLEDKIFMAAISATYTTVTVAAVATGFGGGGDGLGTGDGLPMTEAAIIQEAEMPAYPEFAYEAFQPVVDVALPKQIPFAIDPFKLNGREQVYSEKHLISNNSNVDVKVKISALYYKFKNDTDYLALEEPFDYQNTTPLKAIHMLLKTDYEGHGELLVTDRLQTDVAEFYLKASNYDEHGWLSFNEGSQVAIWVTGTANAFPQTFWQDDDVILKIDYEVEPVLPEQQPVLPVDLTNLDESLVSSEALGLEEQELVSEGESEQIQSDEEVAAGDENVVDEEVVLEEVEQEEAGITDPEEKEDWTDEPKQEELESEETGTEELESEKQETQELGLLEQKTEEQESVEYEAGLEDAALQGEPNVEAPELKDAEGETPAEASAEITANQEEKLSDKQSDGSEQNPAGDSVDEGGEANNADDA